MSVPVCKTGNGDVCKPCSFASGRGRPAKKGLEWKGEEMDSYYLKLLEGTHPCRPVSEVYGNKSVCLRPPTLWSFVIVEQGTNNVSGEARTGPRGRWV